jgi:tRNA dimethylallyltransferase
MEDKNSIPAEARPLLVVIAGPTASGKTQVAVELAKQLQTEILSFDSRQCYRGMNIGTAKPTSEEQRGIAHYFIDSHPVAEPMDAALFADYGQVILDKLFKKYKVIVAVGGTGLYLKALTEGLDLIPEIPTEIRNKARDLYQNEGLAVLQQTLFALDPEFANIGEWQNPQRLMRSLEVIWYTGQPIHHFQKKQFSHRPFEVLLLGLDVPRSVLVERIDQRVDAMMAAGLQEEVKQLYAQRHLNALQTVGYQELFNHFDGKCSLTTSVEQIKIHTRQYAKRQVTWFKKQKDILWIAPDKATEMLSLIRLKAEGSGKEKQDS